jgi:hypothetical protein
MKAAVRRVETQKLQEAGTPRWNFHDFLKHQAILITITTV